MRLGRLQTAPFGSLFTLTPQKTMLGLTEEQRELAADKLADAANVAVGALVFGQVFTDLALSFWRAAGGVAIWLILFAYSLKLRGPDRTPTR